MGDLVGDADVTNMWEEWSESCTASNSRTPKIKLLLQIVKVSVQKRS